MGRGIGGGAGRSGTNLRRDRACGSSGTIREGGKVLAGTREGARQFARRRRANSCNHGAMGGRENGAGREERGGGAPPCHSTPEALSRGWDSGPGTPLPVGVGGESGFNQR